MPAEAPFLFAIAGLSASIAGLAGIVAALRRSAGDSRFVTYRLREIVEFSFANVLLALSIIPAITVFGGLEPSLRIGSAAALAYLLLYAVVLLRRLRRSDLPISGPWVLAVVPLFVASLAGAILALAFGTAAAYEALLLLLLIRPMGAFLLVLDSFEHLATETDDRPSR